MIATIKIADEVVYTFEDSSASETFDLTKLKDAKALYSYVIERQNNLKLDFIDIFRESLKKFCTDSYALLGESAVFTSIDVSFDLHTITVCAFAYHGSYKVLDVDLPTNLYDLRDIDAYIEDESWKSLFIYPDIWHPLRYVFNAVLIHNPKYFDDMKRSLALKFKELKELQNLVISLSKLGYSIEKGRDYTDKGILEVIDFLSTKPTKKQLNESLKKFSFYCPSETKKETIDRLYAYKKSADTYKKVHLTFSDIEKFKGLLHIPRNNLVNTIDRWENANELREKMKK